VTGVVYEASSSSIVSLRCCDSSPAQENPRPKITQLETEVKESLSLGTVKLPVGRVVLYKNGVGDGRTTR